MDVLRTFAACAHAQCDGQLRIDAYALPGRRRSGSSIRGDHRARPGAYAKAALFNARYEADPGKLADELDAALWKALAGVTSFPTHDLFSTFR